MISPRIIKVANKNIQKNVYNSIYYSVYSNLKKVDTDKLFKIYQNSNQEIIYVDFDIQKSNDLLNSILKDLKNNLKPVNTKIPILIILNNPLLSGMGPKINIQSKYVNTIVANVYTKITDYGINNALVEGYIKIKVETLLITPVNQKTKKYQYDMLISSKVISGRVPSLYGGQLLKESNLLNIPFEK